MGGRFFKPDCFSRTAKTSPLLSYPCNRLLAAMWYYCLSFLIFTYLQSVLFTCHHDYQHTCLFLHYCDCYCSQLVVLRNNRYRSGKISTVYCVHTCLHNWWHVSFNSRMSLGVPWVESRPINTCLQGVAPVRRTQSHWNQRDLSKRLGSKPIVCRSVARTAHRTQASNAVRFFFCAGLCIL